MPENDRVLLDETLKRNRAERDPTASEAEFFEYFSAEQILRDYELDPEEIKSGIVGQSQSQTAPGSDGGIDAMYLIVNGRLIRDVDEAKALASLRQNIRFDVICIQAKLAKGFELASLIRFGDTAGIIFDISKQPSEFGERYNEGLLDVITRFREAHSALIPRHPTITVSFFYVSRADSGKIHADITGKAREIESKPATILSSISEGRVVFVGARELIDLSRRPQKTSFTLNCIDSLGSEEDGMVALVELGEYYKLIAENGELKKHLFESNVRDYQGDVDVNKQIRATLEKSDSDAAFWWLNNGITILADRIGGSRRNIVIDEPRIVNGLQTSQEIFNYLRKPGSDKADKRQAVVRVIGSPDAVLQDQIIRATNSQTKIPPEFLRASDDIQRDIEQAFRARGLHYDRRKNSWRKSGLPLDSVVGISELAQSVAAILLKEPDHARARPSRYFKIEYYRRVFRDTISLKTYVVCAQLRKRAEAFLKVAESDPKHRNNLLFYCMMVVSYMLRKKRVNRKIQALEDIDVASLSDSVFQEALDITRPVYISRGQDDNAAKGPTMASELRAKFSKKQSPTVIKSF